ncbi:MULTISPECIES: hypothetical protein [unclassified Novosphingobium]|uniref:DUF4760 domain-containing protein n=1 Tax=unclassified Novosphingobium TaxID=2644732 RepID=UPI0025CBF363|nr:MULTISPECIES: hypothetical protein [unclassified Novosphingobium]HQV04285.1 hypothetical protein [Novosphingobium sp.]
MTHEATGLGLSGRWVELTQIASNVAVILSALIVLPLYLFQREDTIRLERQQIAAELFMRKYDDKLFESYVRVAEAFDASNEAFEIFYGNQEVGKRQLAQSIVSKAGLQNIKLVTDYFDDILVCVEEQVCDADMAQSLIGQDIRNFYCKARFAGIPELRQEYAYPDYGIRLEKFAGDCAKADGTKS